MSNTAKKAYALTCLSPIKETVSQGSSGVVLTRQVLNNLKINDSQADCCENSPLSLVPNTYLARFYILNDVIYEGVPAKEDHLKSAYLVFSSNFYGDLDSYLEGFWDKSQAFAKNIWGNCYGFEEVSDPKSFAKYLTKCQVETSYYFNGSVDQNERDVSLSDQLKGLYLKQEFSKFVWKNQGKSGAELKQLFEKFIQQTQPSEPQPCWQPGKCDIAS